MANVVDACSDCGKKVPAACGESTLVSVKHGWRLTRETLTSGEVVPRWRCRECWREHKRRLEARGPGGDS